MLPRFISSMGTFKFLITFIVIVEKLCQGQKAKFELFSTERCELTGDAEQPFEYSLDLRLVGEDEYAAFAEVSLLEPVTDDFNFQMDLEKYEDGQWKPQSSVEGNMWEYIDKYIPRVYEKLAGLCEPNLPPQFPIEIDTYKAEGLQIHPEDLDIPGGMEGRFKLYMRVNSPDGNVICQMADVEISK